MKVVSAVHPSGNSQVVLDRLTDRTELPRDDLVEDPIRPLRLLERRRQLAVEYLKLRLMQMMCSAVDSQHGDGLE
jgi:hypothetical protein